MCTATILSHELELETILGAGNCGVVYKAKVRGKQCAAKLLKFTHSDEHYQRLLSELTILATVGKHCNLVEFYGKDHQTQVC